MDNLRYQIVLGAQTMRYERFEDLPVWKLAADLAADILVWSQQANLNSYGDIKNQMQRAALSISNNIAEGFERGSTQDLIRFLYYARGSAAEVRSMLCIVHKLPNYRSRDQEVSTLKERCEVISRQIRGWTK